MLDPEKYPFYFDVKYPREKTYKTTLEINSLV